MAQPTFDSKLFFYPSVSRRSSSLSMIRPFQSSLFSQHKFNLLSFSSSIFSFSHPTFYLNSSPESEYSYYFQEQLLVPMNSKNTCISPSTTENLKQIDIPMQSVFQPPQPIDTHPIYGNERSQYQQNATSTRNQQQNQMYLINLNPAINQVELVQMYRQRCGEIRSSHFTISAVTNNIIGLLDFGTAQGLKTACEINEFSGNQLICVDARSFTSFPVSTPPSAPVFSSPQPAFQTPVEKEAIPANKMLAMKNLPFDITNEKLASEMEQRGIYIRPSKIIYHQQNNKFSGILFVDFETQDDATYVYEHLQQWYVGGRNITVEYKLKNNLATPRQSSFYNTPSHGYQNKNYTPRHPHANQTPRGNLYTPKTPGSLNRSSSTGYYTPRQTQLPTVVDVPIDDLLTPLESQTSRIVNETSKLSLNKTVATEKTVQSYAKGPDGSKGFAEQRSTSTVSLAPST